MEKTLVVMAAGIGSRFGGLKQLEPVGPSNEFIIDYSVYDAIKAGFTKVVFVIRKEIAPLFKKTIGERLSDKIKVAYAYQEIEDIPKNMQHLAKMRTKPWGTVQALLVAKDHVLGDFLVINADDFYGLDSFIQASHFLDTNHDPNVYASINFPFIVTNSNYGSVKRAICKLKDDLITDMLECKISLKGNNAYAEPLNGEESFTTSPDVLVAVNMFAFKNNFFKLLEEYFLEYFKRTPEEILKGEILLPDVIKENLQKKRIILKNIISKSQWLGITYPEDLAIIKTKINELIKNKEYPERLW